MKTKIILFLVLLIGGIGFIWWRYGAPLEKDRFTQALDIMQSLESRAIPVALTDDQLGLLEQVYHDSENRIPRMNSFRDSDKNNLLQLLSSAGFSGTEEYNLNPTGARILSMALGKTDEFRTYLDSGFTSDIGNASSAEQIKKLIQSINSLTNDVRLTLLYISWYESIREKICTTNDPLNDPSIAGALKIVYKNNASIVDTCHGSEIQQFKCFNGLYENDASHTVTTTCPHGCNNGKCLDAPVNSLKNFSISLPSSAVVNTAIDMSITALRTDDSQDADYRGSVLIALDDTDGVYPTPQTLVGGFIRLPGAIIFRSTGTKTVTIKDIATGIQTQKTINIVEEETDTENTGKSPINMALLDNTKGLLNGQVNTFFRLDVVAGSQDININTIPLFLDIYRKKIGISSLKLSDSTGKNLDVSITITDQKDHEINSKTISLQIKFNNGYTIPAGSGESFILTGFVGGVTDEYDGITTGMGPKEQFTWYNSSKTTQYTGEALTGYPANTILMRKR